MTPRPGSATARVLAYLEQRARVTTFRRIVDDVLSGDTGHGGTVMKRLVTGGLVLRTGDGLYVATVARPGYRPLLIGDDRTPAVQW